MEAVRSFLQDVQLCSVCVLRFTCDRGANKILQLLKAKNDEEPAAKKVATNPCPVCLGLLSLHSNSMDEICQKVLDQGYQFEKYQVNLSIPVSLPLRNHILICKLTKTFPDLDFVIDPVPIPSVWKKLFAQKLREKKPNSVLHETAVFQIHCRTSHKEANNECAKLFSKCPKNILFPVQCKKSNAGSFDTGTKNHFNHSSVQRAIQILPISSFSDFELEIPTEYFSLDEVVCNNEPLFLVGRYNKYSRRISQTPWLIEDSKKITDSVEEMITESVAKFFECESQRFSACGREDVDVQMLGTGRTFVLELQNPRVCDVPEEVLVKIEEEVKVRSEGKVCVNSLQVTSKKDVQSKMKVEETSKTYIAKCCCINPLTQEQLDEINTKFEPFKIEQKTPVRVLHRRCLSTRKRTIRDLKLTIDTDNDHMFNLTITTDSGTYIKEFVHSDFGRTSPSLKDVMKLGDLDILTLDVLEVKHDWPAPVAGRVKTNV